MIVKNLTTVCMVIGHMTHINDLETVKWLLKKIVCKVISYDSHGRDAHMPHWANAYLMQSRNPSLNSIKCEIFKRCSWNKSKYIKYLNFWESVIFVFITLCNNLSAWISLISLISYQSNDNVIILHLDSRLLRVQRLDDLQFS